MRVKNDIITIRDKGKDSMKVSKIKDLQSLNHPLHDHLTSNSSSITFYSPFERALSKNSMY